MSHRPPPDPSGPVSIDVAQVVRRTVTSLYSHLVTRPTGRAVRVAIESRVREAGARSVSLVDLSEVKVLDFSCADEVVAKLLLRFSEGAPPPEAHFVFRGIGDAHRGPIETVLKRQSLVAVGETGSGRFELLGEFSGAELDVWRAVEERGDVSGSDVEDVFGNRAEKSILERLARRKVLFELGDPPGYRSLATMIPGGRG